MTDLGLIGFRLSFGMPETNNTILYMSFYILTYFPNINLNPSGFFFLHTS